MNIIDAIKSGRRFKRPHWAKDFWITSDDCANTFFNHDLIAEDWIIEPVPEKKIEITKSDLERAWNGISHPQAQSAKYNPLFQTFCKELGFDD